MSDCVGPLLANPSVESGSPAVERADDLASSLYVSFAVDLAVEVWPLALSG